MKLYMCLMYTDACVGSCAVATTAAAVGTLAAAVVDSRARLALVSSSSARDAEVVL